MRILLTGGTGLVGQALLAELLLRGDSVTVLSRQATPRFSHLAPALAEKVQCVQSLSAFTDLNDFDAVVNLAGEPIMAKAWTAAQKARLRDSRIALTQRLSALFLASQTPPRVFLSGSATGIYGDLTPAMLRGGLAENGLFDETLPASEGFAAQLCADWERASGEAQAVTRVCWLRTGLVLSARGGLLAEILPLYRWGLGGKLGSGKQQMPWISLTDMVRALLFLLDTPSVRGAFNLVAPAPVSNAEFNRALSKTLARPACFSVPALALKLALGERTHLLLDSQPLAPNALLAHGFQFHDAQLDLRAILTRD